VTATGADVTGNLTVSEDATVTGNLTVRGTTTYLSSSNLVVQDAFGFFATGSAGTNVDAGIIVQSSSYNDQGSALYHDISSERWSVAKGVATNATAVTPEQFVVTVNTATGDPHLTTSGSYGIGEMHINTDTEEIFIRTS